QPVPVRREALLERRRHQERGEAHHAMGRGEHRASTCVFPSRSESSTASSKWTIFARARNVKRCGGSYSTSSSETFPARIRTLEPRAEADVARVVFSTSFAPGSHFGSLRASTT